MDKNTDIGQGSFYCMIVSYLFALSVSYVLYSLIKGGGLVYGFALYNSIGQETPGNRLLLLAVFVLSSIAAFFLNRHGKTLLPCAIRRSRTLWLSASLVPTKAASSGVR